jgi:hypothetical protein
MASYKQMYEEMKAKHAKLLKDYQNLESDFDGFVVYAQNQGISFAEGSELKFNKEITPEEYEKELDI